MSEGDLCSRFCHALKLETFRRAKAYKWGLFHPKYNGKIIGGTIMAGCGDYYWATGVKTLPATGKHRIIYRVDKIQTNRTIPDIIVGVASRAAKVEVQHPSSYLPGCYNWVSYNNGTGSSYLYADGISHASTPQESKVGSIIEIIVDQKASTVEFLIDSKSVGGDAHKLRVKPKHKRDLIPAACVYKENSALTLLAVEEFLPDE